MRLPPLADEGLGVRMALSTLLPTTEDAQTVTGSGLATCFSGCGEQPRQRHSGMGPGSQSPGLSQDSLAIEPEF